MFGSCDGSRGPHHASHTLFWTPPTPACARFRETRSPPQGPKTDPPHAQTDCIRGKSLTRKIPVAASAERLHGHPAKSLKSLGLGPIWHLLIYLSRPDISMIAAGIALHKCLVSHQLNLRIESFSPGVITPTNVCISDFISVVFSVIHGLKTF